MNKYIIAIIIGIIQISLSINLIMRQEKRFAMISEVCSSFILLLLLNGFFIQLNKTFLLYLKVTLIEYICVKIFLLAFFVTAKYCSFYIIKDACWHRRNKKSKKLKLVRTFNNLKYGPRVKLGLPGMADKTHKKTKVKFDSKGFPIFKSYYTVKIGIRDFRKTREQHFYMANKMLYNDKSRKAKIKAKFTRKQIKELSRGETPSGYTWHHYQDAGVLQLVNAEVHAKTSHVGGYSIWGGK